MKIGPRCFTCHSPHAFMKNQRSTEHPAIAGAAASSRDWRMLLVLAALIALFFGKILLGSAWLWEDMLYYSYPVRSFAATSMAMGQFPLWNPYTFNGMPFLADIQTTVLYVPCILLTLFVHNGVLNFYWLEVMVIAHFVLAGWSMFLLASSFSLKRLPALFAGASYMLSGFMITHAIHQQIITMVAWFPLIVLLFRRSLTEDSWRPVFLCALILGHSTFAGYPQLSLYLHFFLLVYALFLLMTSCRGAAILSRTASVMLAKAVTIVGLGLAVAAIQLLPTAELADLSQRAQITYQKSAEGALAWPQLITMFSPKFFGTASGGGYNYWGPGTYWYYWETCIYLGILPLLLMLLTPLFWRRNAHVVFLGGTAIFTLLFALGDNFPLHRLFYEIVPGFSKFRDPARMGVFLSFAASLLSAFSLQTILHDDRKEFDIRRARAVLFGAAGVGMALWLATVTGMLDGLIASPGNPAAALAIRSSAHLALAVLLVSAAVLLIALTRRFWSHRAGWVLLAVFFADMILFGGDQNNSPVNPGDYFHRADPVVRFLREEAKTDVFRVNTRNPFGMIMDRNQGMVDRIPTMEGYTPLILQRALPQYGSDTRSFDLLNVRFVTVADRAAGRLVMASHPTYLPRAFFLYDVRVVQGDEKMLAAVKDTAWNHRTTALIEKPAPIPIIPLPYGMAPQWKARITDYENNRLALDVETPVNGLLVLSEIYYPGWTATIDGTGTEVLRTDYTLRGIAVPAGSHRIVVQFSHPPFVAGGWLTAGALVVCLAGVAFAPSGRSRRPEKGN